MLCQEKYDRVVLYLLDLLIRVLFSTASRGVLALASLIIFEVLLNIFFKNSFTK
jgi:hypothetical protein